MGSNVPKLAADAVLIKSKPLPDTSQVVKGYTFEDEAVDYDALFKSYSTTGFQATHFGRAVEAISAMVCDLTTLRRYRSDISYKF